MRKLLAVFNRPATVDFVHTDTNRVGAQAEVQAGHNLSATEAVTTVSPEGELVTRLYNGGVHMDVPHSYIELEVFEAEKYP